MLRQSPGEVPTETRGMNSDTRVSFDRFYAQVLAMTPKCHCDDVGVNTAGVQALETDVQGLSQLNGLTSAPCVWALASP